MRQAVVSFSAPPSISTAQATSSGTVKPTATTWRRGGARSSTGIFRSPFLYQAGRLTDLGILPGGTQSYAYAINNLGQAVGASDSSAGAQRAVLFERGVLRDLNGLIPASAGWLLTEAKDINDSGQIVGTGIFEGQVRAFLLTPR